MRLGIFVSETWGAASDVEQIRKRAKRAESLGFASGWVPYLPWAHDALASVQLAASVTERLELGTAVIPTYLFHPLALARQAATVEAAIGRPLHLGIGCSNEAVIAMHGLEYARPARHVRECLEIIGPALETGANPQGEREAAGLVQYAGEIFQVGSVYGTPGAKNQGSVLVGALGPKMLEAAGGCADGTITTWSNPLAIRENIRPGLEAAAEAAGRPAPRVAAVLPVTISRNPEKARAHAQKTFAIYESLPRYRRMMDLGGVAQVSDLCVIGDRDSVAEQLGAYRSAGVTDFLAAPLASEEDDWEATAEQLAQTAL